MSTVAQKSDVSDPATIAKFASLVSTEQRLTALYLLTVADIRGTSPKVWNAWKGKLLESLFTQTLHYLQGSQNNQINATNPTEHAQDTVRSLLPRNLDPHPLWKDLDDAYFLRNQANDAAWHTQSLLNHLSQSVVVDSRLAPDGTGIQVLVYANDQSELFARICSCFDALSLAVLDAQVHTTRTGHALDHFVLQLPIEQAVDDPTISTLLTSIKQKLHDSLLSASKLPAPRSARLPRQVRHFAFAPQCHITPDEKGTGYMLELQAVDQASLLYRIALVLAKHTISVHTARITTLGGRAIDFFLLTGDVLNSPKLQLQFEADLLTAVAI